MLILKWLAIGLVVLVVLVIVAAQFGALSGTAPTDLGVRDGRLKPPSNTPNSVSSQASLYPDHPQRQYADIAPLPLKGEAVASMARLKGVLEGMRGVKVIKSEPGYLYAQCTTPLMKYVDDLELWADPAGVIQVRSASRIGRKDLGANRARIDELRERYLARD